MIDEEITVVGHIGLDIIPTLKNNCIEKFTPGSMIDAGNILLSIGGVFNTGIDLIKLGIGTKLIGKIGEDYFGEIIINLLNKIDKRITKYLKVVKDESTSYTIVLSPPKKDRMFIHFHGTNDSFSYDDVPFDEIKNSKIFHFGYPPLMKNIYLNSGNVLKKILEKIRAMGIITSLDMSFPDVTSESGLIDWECWLKNVLPFVDVFLPSFEEIVFMLDKTTYNRLNNFGMSDVISFDYLKYVSNKLLDMGVNIVVLKLGEYGLYLATTNKKLLNDSNLKNLINIDKWANKSIYTPCFSTEVLGTTGAGDATIAGFLAGLLNGNEPEDAVTIATAVGAYSVESIDATSGVKSLDAILERISKGWNKLPTNLSSKLINI
ncbi:carbohydrate kinase family protein [Thermoanaerobacterium thermosulfurigenes]|uniref:carbohydrate kinase family protein n=1 Tax=Thermoanaerobacterium thermosulfurigenes TaxID=33950 RepID=UPI003EF9A87B